MADTDKKGSSWAKGAFRIALVVVVLAGFYYKMPETRPYIIGVIWFLLISAVIGVGIAAVLRWWNERRPVTPEDEEGIRLNLNDEDPRKN